jgi:hypothetical protein
MARIFNQFSKAFFGLSLLFLWGCEEGPKTFSHDLTPPPSPWIGKEFDNGNDKFTFAIFTDLNGGERPGIFSVGAAQLDLLRPEFILSIGDLIDGGTEDKDQLKLEWDDFDRRAEAARAPIFRVGGNHDLTNVKMREVWQKRYGPRYYHFIYKDVLFLILDSEDFEDDRMQEIYLERAKAIKVLDGPDPEEAYSMPYFQMIERQTGEMRAEQNNYFEDVLKKNPQVKWTFLFMHKPLWKHEDGKGMQTLEAALEGRNYTVFNGHLHSFEYTKRLGMDYIMLGTTGGSQRAGNPNAFDHLTLITMDNLGPTISHLKMEGILDKTGHIPAGGDGLCFQHTKCGEK